MVSLCEGVTSSEDSVGTIWCVYGSHWDVVHAPTCFLVSKAVEFYCRGLCVHACECVLEYICKCIYIIMSANY